MRRVVLLVLVFFAVSASAALACNDPSLGGVTPSAGRGEPVSFSAVHLDPGATYSISMAGREVTSGTAGGGTIAGSFTMPDLGVSGVYYVELRVAHEDGTWVSSQPVRFTAPAPAPQPAPPVEAPASEPVPPPKAQTAPQRPVSTPAPARSVQPAARALPKVSRSEPVPRSRPAPVTATAAPRPVAHAAGSPKTTIRRKHVPPHESARPRAVQPAPVIDYLRPEPLIPMDKPRRRFPPLPRPDSGLPLWLVVAVALVGATGAAAGVGAFVRRRAAVRARDLQMEAELQAMIAEARSDDRVGFRSD